LAVYPVLPGLTFTTLKTPKFATDVQAAPNFYEVRIAQAINPRWTWTLIYDFLHDFPWGNFLTVSELRTLMGFFNAMGGEAGSFLFLDQDDNYVGPALVTTPWAANTYYPLGAGIYDPTHHWQLVTTAGTTGATIPVFNDSGGTTASGTAVFSDQGLLTGIPNTPLAQLDLVNDGAGNYYSPIQRTLDGNFYEDVTDLDGAISLYAAGVHQTTGYSVLGPGLALPTGSYMGLYVKWTAAPTPPITAQFNFYFRVRFATDSQDFEKFLNAGSQAAAVVAGQGGGIWTIGGSYAENGTGTLKLTTARPTPL
jgi:hypothetical protein